jgi:hypothetical protein
MEEEGIREGGKVCEFRVFPQGGKEKGGISCGSRHVPHGLISAIKPCDVTSCGGRAGGGDSL